ncbi:MAG: cell division protein ZapD [Alphaproteobacteria bacterium]|nr:cell division protein ZapD [Alphaproteobacteria bacterium]
MIVYEHPLNERVRTYLRLEYLFRRFEWLLGRENPIEHHFCFSTVFEIAEVASRADLKSDLLKDLERHKQQFLSYRGNPAVAEAVLDEWLNNLESCYDGLHSNAVRFGNFINEHELLSNLRNRMSIPGGTCGFDMPLYLAWQHKSAEDRREDVLRWTEPLQHLYASVNLLLRLSRDSAQSQMVSAVAGQFQQNLSQGRYQLMRLRFPAASNMVPEISGNRMMVSVRFNRPDDQGRLQPCSDDLSFEMALCT